MYRKGQKREEAMPGTGSLHLRSSGNKHVSLTYIYLYVLHLEVYKYLHSCSHMHSLLWSPYAHIHICNCASLRCLCNHICAPISIHRWAEPLHNAHHTVTPSGPPQVLTASVSHRQVHLLSPLHSHTQLHTVHRP